MVGAATGYEFTPIHHTLRKLRDLGLVKQRNDDGKWDLTDAGRAMHARGHRATVDAADGDGG